MSTHTHNASGSAFEEDTRRPKCLSEWWASNLGLFFRFDQILLFNLFEASKQGKSSPSGGFLKWGYPQIIHILIGFIHYKPAILGQFWGITILGNLHSQPFQPGTHCGASIGAGLDGCTFKCLLQSRRWQHPILFQGQAKAPGEMWNSCWEPIRSTRHHSTWGNKINILNFKYE